MSEKRCAIIGTAPSWVRMPWDDPSLEAWTINDGYCSRDQFGNGPRRINRHYDLHPLDKMWFRKKEQKVVNAADVPPGHYVRPEGHIEWLKETARTVPVFLQDFPPSDWPVNAQRFPIEAIEARFGNYWASGPSYMVAHAIVEGYREIHIYGIHLATQAEYVEQRPNFEHLLGIAKGLGITVVMAEESPVMKHGWKYGYEPKPHGEPSPYHFELDVVLRKKAAVVKELVEWPRFKSKAEPLERLRRLEAREIEIRQRLSQQTGCGTLACNIVAA
jgi:hypothetical protein